MNIEDVRAQTETLKLATAMIKRLQAEAKEQTCRFDCRTAKENWMIGYEAGRKCDPRDHYDTEEAYREWQRRQKDTS